MYAIHSTLLPPSAIHHTLFLPHFTPSTIYPLPRPSTSTAQDIKVVGNLIVGGLSDLRVFEIREELRPVIAATAGEEDDAMGEVKREASTMVDGQELGDSFFDTGPSHRAPLAYKTHRTLHHLTTHQVHGTITGLAALRTIDSSIDGLDRLLVSFKDAKLAILEWSRGDVATVSLHTYERCPQMTTGDMSTYTPRLRTDPLSRIALLSLPDDGLAVLPIVQEQSDLDMTESFPRDVPYSPSFVLALTDVSPLIKNLADLVFLTGYNSPTLAILYTPTQTWAGRYQSSKDTYILEIRTMDLSSGSYPLLTRVDALPSDTLYIVPCPRELGGVVLVTTTGIIHVDQGGRVVCTSVNAWWGYTTNRARDRSYESRKLTLEGSRATFVGDKDMLLVLATGRAHQVRMTMDGRAVGSIVIEEEVGILPPPSSISRLGTDKVFVGSPEGDSVMYETQMVREKVDQAEEKKPAIDMELDYDDDLYADAPPVTNGAVNGAVVDVYTGPARLELNECDRITGIGKIIDMDFGIAVTDQGTRTYPQLVTIGGGTKNSTLNVLRRGIPINKRRRFNELSTADGVWFLPVQRSSGTSGQASKFRHIPEELRTTLLLSSEGSQTRVFSLSNKANPEQIGRIASTTVHAAPFFARSSVLLVSPHSVDLLDGDGKHVQSVYTSEGSTIVSASVSDPFAVVRRADGTAVFFIGDSVAKTVSQSPYLPDGEQSPVQAIEVFTDTTGIYRTFERSQDGIPSATPQVNGISVSNGHRNSISTSTNTRQTAEEHIQRLQHETPAISMGKPTVEEAVHTMRGTQWLAVLTVSGELQIRSLPDLSLVFQSEGLAASDATFTDDLLEGGSSGVHEDPDVIKQMLFHPLGRDNPRPHLLVLHKSGRLNTYEAQPRFTLDTPNLPRRSLAIRYRRIHTQVLSSTTGSKLAYKMHPFNDLEGYAGVFVTGEKPQWIIGSSTHPVRSFGLKQAAATFGRTTHLGGMGEYFIRIEDGTFICYLPPTLTTDFEMPCDRYEMDRVYTNIAFDPPSGHYVGAAAITVPFQAYDEEGEPQYGPEGDNLIPPTNERSTLELFSQGSDPWRVIDGYDFDQNEVVLCMQSVNLESSSSPSGFRDFIAIGTGFDFAEDRATRGNTYIFEIVETVGPSPKESGWRLKQRAKDPARNPVSALGNINSYLLNSNGPKLYVKGLDYDQRLMGLAFLDVNIYSTSIKVFKNFILVTDLLKSIWLVSLQDEPYKFTVISKDLREVHALTGDFLVQEGQVSFLITDRKGDMRMLDFDPADPDSLNGERLLLRTEYHMGASVTASKMIARRRTTDEEFAPQSQMVYGTADGSLTTIVAVKPARFKRLQLVADQLTRNAQHSAGLNPKAFRTVQNDLLPRPLTRGILDGQLLSHFALQPVRRQREMMRQIGTDEVTVASDLQALGGFW